MIVSTRGGESRPRVGLSASDRAGKDLAGEPERNLLAFAVELDRELAASAQEWQISVATAREILQVQSFPTWDPKRWHREAALQETLRGRYHGVCGEVQEPPSGCAGQRLVENFNSRLRSYSSSGGSWARILDAVSTLLEPPPVPGQ